MSRRNRRQPHTSHADIQRLVEVEVSRRLNLKTLPPGAVQRPISDALLMQMQANQAPAKQGEVLFSPGAPLRPIDGLSPQGMPRQFPFQVGYNIASLPRNTESTSFDTLRNLANLYDGIALCEQVWLDIVSKLHLVIKPRPELGIEDAGSDKALASDIARYTDFFSYPDPGQDLDLKSWLRMAVRDQLQVDAVAMYIRRNRAGGIYSLELVDGTTIKPLIDTRGRRPTPPYPAYQQFVYGAPGDLLTADDLLYIRETPRTDSVYGLSRVERIILRINQALRKQNRDLSNFTDGSTPSGLLSPPDDGSMWTPEALLAYQEVWDGLLAGNDQARARVKVIPPGAAYTKTGTDDILVDFDRFLLNVTVACYSMTMADLGFTESVNKSSGDSQENVFYRRAVQPLVDRYAALFTHILRKYFNEQRLIVTFGGFEESEDFVALSTAYVNLVKAGIISAPVAARQLKLPVEINVPPYYGTATGPVFLEDAANPELRQAQLEAKVQGAKQAAQNLNTQPPGNAAEGGEQGQSGNSSKKTQPTDDSKNADNAGGSSDNNATTADQQGDEERSMESSPPLARGGRLRSPSPHGGPRVTHSFPWRPR